MSMEAKEGESRLAPDAPVQQQRAGAVTRARSLGDMMERGLAQH